MNRLEGKVAIVTGTSSGMGKSIAIRMAEEGAKVVMTARRAEKLEETAAIIRSNGGNCLPIAADVTKPADWKMIVEKTISEYGKIDILVNNAGTGGNPNAGGMGPDFDLDTWRSIIDTNLLGGVCGIYEVLPYMKEQKGGSIVNIDSISAVSAMGGPTAYTSSKGAVRSFTMGLAKHLAPSNIRVNAILPGIISTEMTAFVIDENNDMTKPMRDDWYRKTKLPRLGEGDDIAYAAIYLASDESSFVTGAELVVDGGYIID